MTDSFRPQSQQTVIDNTPRTKQEKDEKIFFVGGIYRRDVGGRLTEAMCVEIQASGTGPRTVVLGIHYTLSESAPEAREWTLVGSTRPVEQVPEPRYMKQEPDPKAALADWLKR